MKNKLFLFLLIVFCISSFACFGQGIAGTLQDARAKGKIDRGCENRPASLWVCGQEGCSKRN